jgi:hypothetical protein
MTTNSELEATVRALEARLRVVEDIAAIQELKARYGALVDQRYTDGAPRPEAEVARIADRIAELFTEDAVWDGGRRLGVCRGRREITERFLNPTLGFTWHYFVKPRIQVDGDGARGTWDILAPCSDRDGVPLWMAGVEDDEYTRVDGVWLHSSMKLRILFMAPYEKGWSFARPGG